MRSRWAGYRLSMSDDFDASLDGARSAADRDEVAEWVACFLASPGSDNAALNEQLQEKMEYWAGPVRLPFDSLHRLAGPADHPTLERLDDDDLETVEGMEESLEEGWEPAPLIVAFRNEQLVVEDGNHRIEGLRRSGEQSYWAIVGFATEAQRKRFSEEWADAI